MNNIDRITKVIDQISLWSGKAISWLIIPMAAVLVWEVFIRYAYRPTLWAVDMATMLYGTHFFIAAAMTLYLGKHIRTDFFYQNWSMKTQCWVDAICYLFLFLPGMVMFIWLSWDFFCRILGPEGRTDDDLETSRIPVQIGHPPERRVDTSPGNLGTDQMHPDDQNGSGSPLPAGCPPRNYLNHTISLVRHDR